jgi:hypothetical protein
MPTHRRRRDWDFIVSVLILAVGLAAVVTMAALHTSRPPPSANPYAAIAPNPRIPDTFRFEPKPDITPYELALALAPMLGSVDFLERMRPFYDAMPPEAKRHWLPPHEHPHEH